MRRNSFFWALLFTLPPHSVARMVTLTDDKLARRNLTVLVLAQAILGNQLPMVFIMAGLAGQSLAKNICFATMPISCIVLGAMLASDPLSNLMQKVGRKKGFFLGTFFGALGGLIAAYGLYVQSFGWFLLASLCTGVFMASQGFYRFAAIDTASESFRPKAVSYVMASGLIAAIIGPQLVKLTDTFFSVPFLMSYLVIVALNLIGSLIFFAFRNTDYLVTEQGEERPRNRLDLLKSRQIFASILCAMIAYSMMNLVMTSTPLAVIGCGFSTSDVADIVSAHVLAMFVPSFFTGHLIVRFGARRILAIGLVMLAIAGLCALEGIDLGNFFAALIMVGLGWNFSFIGATTLLSESHKPHERGRVQGMNDFFVGAGVTLASLTSGGLMNCSGNSALEGWTAVNLAMLPLLFLAALALFFLTKTANRPKDYK